jgi:lysophospholipase L1-like esterase
MNYFMVAQYYQPDIVLLHVGGNDAFPLLYPHYQPDYMYYKQANGGVMRLRPFERTLVRYSYFYRNLVALWLVDQEFFIFPHVLQDMDRDATLARVRQQAPVAFQSNINAIMSHARANGAKVVLVGYMHIPYADYEKTDPSFLGFGRSMDMATAKNLQVMQQLAQEYQQLYVALDRSKFKADWFYDYCHLKAPGHQEKAQQIYAAMRANGVFEK